MIIDPRDRADLVRFFSGHMLPAEVSKMMRRYPQAFPHMPVSRRGASPRPMRYRPQEMPPIEISQDGRRFDLYDFLAVNRVAGLLVLKEGEIAFEYYDLGLDERTPWGSASVAKSIASTLVGAAILDGKIQGLNAKLTEYLDVGGVYSDVTIRQLLRMCSGVKWNEDYVDPASDRRVLLEEQFRFRNRAVVDHMSRLERAAPAGERWVYNTGESNLVGALLENATGKPVTEYLSEKIWSRLGMEQDASWWVDSPGGTAVTGSGIGAILRDYARFGQFVLDDGTIDGERVVPEGWFAEAGATFEAGGKKIPYGFMWWIPEYKPSELEGAFQAEGIYGQYIHVNPQHGIVIAMLCARSKPSMKYRFELNDDTFFAAVARALSAGQ